MSLLAVVVLIEWAAAADLKRTRRQFKNFVKRNKEFLSRENRETIIKLLSSHGRDEELLFFAELVKDYERVLTHHIQQVRNGVWGDNCVMAGTVPLLSSRTHVPWFVLNANVVCIAGELR